MKTKSEKLPYLEAKVIRGKAEPTFVNSGVIVDSLCKVILVDGENSGEIMTPPMRGYMGSTFKIFSAVDNFNYDFLLLIFLLNKEKYKNSKIGAAIPHLNKDLFRESYIAVPPLNEQQRILEKIDFLSTYIDEYGKIEDELFELDSTIKDKLKKSILQYAIEGKLVKQDPNDEPASVLLERIKQEKEQLIREGKIKRDKNESYIYQGDDKNYYENLPFGWAIVQRKSIILKHFGGGTPSKDISAYWKPEIPWCSVKDLGNRLYINSTIDMISTEGLENSSSNIVPKGEIILCSRMAVGKIRVPLIDMAINQDLKCIIVSKNILKEYYIISSITSELKSTGTTVKGLDFNHYLNQFILLPPLKEQHRIVSKLDHLFFQINI